MQRLTTLFLALALLLSTAACSPTPPAAPQPSTTSTATTGTVAGTPPSPAPRPSRTPPTTTGEFSGAAVLKAINTGTHPGYDRVVFEFDGALPTHHAEYVDRVTQSGSGFPVPLRGNAFLQLTMHEATMDNSFQVTDERQIRRYPGPKRIAPALTAVKEIAAAGDFEAALDFGIGLDRRFRYEITRLTAPTRVVVDFFHTG